MNCIFTTFFTKGNDPQRTQNWIPDDFNKIKDFYNSILLNNLNCNIFHDSFSEEFIDKYQTKKVNFIRSDSSGLNLLDVRWSIYKRYLENDSLIDNIFCVDISDVVVLNDPFIHIENDRIYCGDEEEINEKSNWMLHGYDCLKNQEIKDNAFNYLPKKILNAGILGGQKNIIYDVICKIVDILETSNVQHATVDMSALNYVLYTYYPDKIIHGFPVNTVYNKYETENQNAWFRHK
jgi:hypothetical protein